jgi:hypothetical protein
VAGAFTLLAVTDAHAVSSGVTKVVINNGENIVVGATETTKFSVVVTAKDPSGITKIDSYIYSQGAHGFSDGNGDSSCVNTSGTTYKCTETYTLKAGNSSFPRNAVAGPWSLVVSVYNNDGDDIAVNDPVTSVKVLKRAKLTANATPEPVTKNHTLTVTGKLTRANWSTKKYAGYGSQKVKLQFEKSGATSFTTVKTVTSSSTGAVKATAKATADGTWRFLYSGSSTTATVASAGDYVDVR